MSLISLLNFADFYRFCSCSMFRFLQILVCSCIFLVALAGYFLRIYACYFKLFHQVFSTSCVFLRGFASFCMYLAERFCRISAGKTFSPL